MTGTRAAKRSGTVPWIGRWTDAAKESVTEQQVTALLQLEDPETRSKFDSGSLGLDPLCLDVDLFGAGLTEARRTVGMQTYPMAPNCYKRGCTELGLDGPNPPSWTALEEALRRSAEFSLLLLASTPTLRLEAACFERAMVPIPALSHAISSPASVSQEDYRRNLIGLLPLLAANSHYRFFLAKFSGMLCRTFDQQRFNLAMKLWLAIVEQGAFKDGQEFRPFGRSLLCNPSMAAWACKNTSTKRVPLSVKAVSEVGLRDLENRTAKCPIFFIEDLGELKGILDAFVA